MIGISVPGLTANGIEVPSAGQGVPSVGPYQKDRFVVLTEDPTLGSCTLREQVRPTSVFCVDPPRACVSPPPHPPRARSTPLARLTFRPYVGFGLVGPGLVKHGSNSDLVAITMHLQVRCLETSVTEVFKAPRNMLSRAVTNVACARLCPSSEGGAADLIRTRAAARAAAAASGGAPRLVSMRACMSFQDEIPAGCLDGRERDRTNNGGIVVATVAPDNSRGGKGLDVVWITVLPNVIPSSERERDHVAGGDRNSIRITGVRSPPGFQVRQVAFYGSVPGVPTQNEGRLAIVLEPVADRDQPTALHLLDLETLAFTKVGPLASFDSNQGLASPGRKTRGGGASRDVVGAARAQGAEAPFLSELSSRSRELPAHVKGVAVALSGARGIACAVSSSKHLIVFDLEEDEEEDMGEEEDE